MFTIGARISARVLSLAVFDVVISIKSIILNPRNRRK